MSFIHGVRIDPFDLSNMGTTQANPKISYYYKYNFISPEPIFAEVKEEFKSYFQTGIVDDILFPTYTEDILRALGKSSYKIETNIFQLEDYEFRLPDNFESVRELWLVTPFDKFYRMPSSCYEQATVRITPEQDRCDCGDMCAPKELKVTYKTQETVIQRFYCHYLLRPGNVSTLQICSNDSLNRFSDSVDSFDILNGRLITNFPFGTVYMVYYVKEYDDNQNMMVPDNPFVKEYIKSFLKFKCMETVFNNITDETFNQVQGKLAYYESKMYDAKVKLETELKKQTIDQQIRSAKAARRRFDKYRIT